MFKTVFVSSSLTGVYKTSSCLEIPHSSQSFVGRETNMNRLLSLKIVFPLLLYLHFVDSSINNILPLLSPEVQMKSMIVNIVSNLLQDVTSNQSGFISVIITESNQTNHLSHQEMINEIIKSADNNLLFRFMDYQKRFFNKNNFVTFYLIIIDNYQAFR